MSIRKNHSKSIIIVKVVREEFLIDPKNGDFDTIGFLYFLTPEGHKVELNRFFKEENGQMVPIDKTEFDERKTRG